MVVSRISNETKRTKTKQRTAKKNKHIDKLGKNLSEGVIRKLLISLLEDHGYIKKDE